MKTQQEKWEKKVYEIWRTVFVDNIDFPHYVDDSDKITDQKKARCTCCYEDIDVIKILGHRLLERYEDEG